MENFSNVFSDNHLLLSLPLVSATPHIYFFLWEGGNNNKRRLHLVNWDIIKKPFLEGGLQIQDLAAKNITLGSKLLWNIVSGNPSWSKRVLWKKYFHGQRLRCLD